MARPSNPRTFALLGTTLALAGCASHTPHPAPEGAPVSLNVATAHVESLPVVYRASGTVRGRNTAILTSKTTGYVRAVRVRPGDRVTAGQSLVAARGERRARVGREGARRARPVDGGPGPRPRARSRRRAPPPRSPSRPTTVQRRSSRTTRSRSSSSTRPRRAGGAQSRRRRWRRRALRSVSSGIDEAKAALGEAQATLGYARHRRAVRRARARAARRPRDARVAGHAAAGRLGRGGAARRGRGRGVATWTP